jgi:papain like protease
MPTNRFAGQQLDARPDRVDLRDRPYLPRVISLPRHYPDLGFIARRLPGYTKAGLILDQKGEGACTGFGLAAVVNYLLWKQAPPRQRTVTRVSPRMLYHLARFYDEWPGEDYEGSSCRGAMKGWHRHGVCDETHWPYLDKQNQFVKPLGGWEADAASRPLGAYYRIDRKSIVDMQAAIVETGAIYVSSDVHAGWDPKRWKKTAEDIAVITVANPASTGGHAFALVGYTPDGFIVQNSWGPAWATGGFAILTYDDWIERGNDAWVAALGAPTASAVTRRPTIIEAPSEDRAAGFWSVARVQESGAGNGIYRRWDEQRAYEHTIVMGNNGIVINRIPDSQPGLPSLERVVHDNPAAWLDPAKGRTKLMLFAHGGLNSEDAALKRVQTLAPHFDENGIYPVFFAWKTGVLETVVDLIEDWLEKFVPGSLTRGLWGDVKEAAQEAKDRLIESACQELHIKALWSQMKQNAEAAATEPNPTLGHTIKHLAALKRQWPSLELHLVGHSAGAIFLGHVLDVLSDPQWAGAGNLKVSSCTLFAPACTMDFALTHYLGAVGKALPNQNVVTFEVLTDRRERKDTVGPYGKSLLYLISRGLENYHKTPVLGLDAVWNKANDGDWGNDTLAGQVKAWRKNWSGPAVEEGDKGDASDGTRSLPWQHGTFDNDVEVMTRTITAIRGKKLVAPITDLTGY